MRRGIALILLLVALGLLTTISLAWLGAGIASLQIGSTIVIADIERARWHRSLPNDGWEIRQRQTPLVTVRRVEWCAPRAYSPDFAIGESVPSWSIARERARDPIVERSAEYGWPLRSMRSREIRPTGIANALLLDRDVNEPDWDRGWPIESVSITLWGKGAPPSSVILARGWIVIAPVPLGQLGRLPLAPVWWGFVGNTAFWAAVWAIPFYGARFPWILRSWLRQWRTCCAGCGHRVPPTGAERCNECGESPRKNPRAVTPTIITCATTAAVLLLAACTVPAMWLSSRVRGFNALQSAALEGDLREIDHQVSAIASQSTERARELDGNGVYSPLGLAAATGEISAMQKLIAAGADPLGASQKSRTISPLLLAAANRQPRSVELLLEAIVSMDAEVVRQVFLLADPIPSALQFAAANGDGESIELLFRFRATQLDQLPQLEIGATVDSAVIEATPLPNSLLRRAAAHARDGSALEALLRHLVPSASEQSDDSAPSWRVGSLNRSGVLASAARFARIDQMTSLLALGADPNGADAPGLDGSPLVAAIWSGDARAVKLLLDAGANAEPESAPALSIAVAAGELEIAWLLVRAGADPRRSTDAWPPAVMVAARLARDSAWFEMLSQADAVRPRVAEWSSPDSWYQSLHFTQVRAGSSGDLTSLAGQVDWERIDDEALQHLIRVGRFFQGEPNDGQSLLRRAMLRGELRAARRLLAAGADEAISEGRPSITAVFAQEVIDGKGIAASYVGEELEAARRGAKVILDAIKKNSAPIPAPAPLPRR